MDARAYGILSAPLGAASDPTRLTLLSQASVRVLSCAIHQADARWRTPVRVLENHFLLYTLRGEHHSTVCGRALQCRAGSFLLVSPGQAHQLGPGQRGAMPLNAAVHFTVCDALGLPARDLFPEPLWHAPDGPSWSRRLELLAAAMKQHPAAAPVMGETLLRTLFLDLLAEGHALNPGSTVRDPRVARSLARIHADLAQAVSVRQLARDAGLGVLQFRKLFAREVHATPKEFMDRARLGAAATLLLETDLRVKEVARRSGYVDEHHFQKRFKAYCGSTPGAFRRRPWG